MKDIKVFYCSSVNSFGVEHFNSSFEVSKFIETKIKVLNNCAFYQIEYIKNTKIGKISSQMNKCFGTSPMAIERNKALINLMYNFIDEYNFKELIFVATEPTRVEKLLKAQKSIIESSLSNDLKQPALDMINNELLELQK